MKKIKLNNGLALSKKVLASLQNEQMSSLKGGQGIQVRGSKGASCSCDSNSCNGQRPQHVTQ